MSTTIDLPLSVRTAAFSTQPNYYSRSFFIARILGPIKRIKYEAEIKEISGTISYLVVYKNAKNKWVETLSEQFGDDKTIKEFKDEIDKLGL